MGEKKQGQKKRIRAENEKGKKIIKEKEEKVKMKE